MDTALAIEYIQPCSEYMGVTIENTKEEYDKIIWTDNRIEKPTWKEIEIAWGVRKDIPEPKSEEDLLKDRIEALETRILELEKT